MGNYTPEPRVGSDADICSSVLYSHHGFVKHGTFLNSGIKRVWLFFVYCCGHQEISHILYWCTMADPGFPRRRTPTQKCRPNILADFPIKLQKKKPKKLDQAVTRVWCPLPLVPSTVWTVSYFTGSLLTAREGNVFTSICHSVHNWPHGYSATAHPCYSAVGTHPTGVLSCFSVFHMKQAYNWLETCPYSRNPYWEFFTFPIMFHPLYLPITLLSSIMTSLMNPLYQYLDVIHCNHGLEIKPV